MKYIVSILLLLITYCTQAQSPSPPVKSASPVTIVATGYPGGVVIEATNPGLVPYTVVLTLDLVNMKSSAGLLVRKLVIPSKKKIMLARLTPNPGQTYSYKYNYRSYLGNTVLPPTSTGFVYQLPFEAGKAYTLIQGNNGSFSHSNKAALDFMMPENTTVCAARAGIVAQVKQDSNDGCPTSDCKEQGNYIIIYHEDGSYATYVHLRQNGSLVNIGQQVTAGTPIGYSGNTGWSSSPHLHFDVAIPNELEKTTIPVTFSIDGRPSNVLETKKQYSR